MRQGKVKMLITTWAINLDAPSPAAACISLAPDSPPARALHCLPGHIPFWRVIKIKSNKIPLRAAAARCKLHAAGGCARRSLLFCMCVCVCVQVIYRFFGPSPRALGCERSQSTFLAGTRESKDACLWNCTLYLASYKIKIALCAPGMNCEFIDLPPRPIRSAQLLDGFCCAYKWLLVQKAAKWLWKNGTKQSARRCATCE